ncbi:hypothetical protein DWB61_00015 [Ancylomarina euxinus]|uniref:Uncharacterized protein n=1 Tax=Ancylomarina euxinus TaxID=2283627 RepID=A0A425Y7D7_9BACT|nr:hypothetical protein [Ancylomarina euxinus]MCZ4693704.1 hypothetical protein [Ancylomarina euxinus]MUP13931.1 hypothetical protein [Ancylomarina euxinus]RRG24441.1 hypothetical protein DWB61_00015 [Ancylomarina euxinus]
MRNLLSFISEQDRFIINDCYLDGKSSKICIKVDVFGKHLSNENQYWWICCDLETINIEYQHKSLVEIFFRNREII